ncbi:MAG: DUF167 domain-containing protein [Candidatus Pacebacteria bacterium]|nr:DUF167 domain-containing protein [Candidatus Paceibacterota bacterium]MBP9058104.1 DUF167 domain-containing protein [Candidatus Paceibacterota bacterium]MBP9769998.1 DUF167 domain-containing protein [Candidatus Paceibacterota bacterium]
MVKKTPKYIHAKVSAGARRDFLEETKPGYFIISVREKAERGEANARVVTILKSHLKAKNVRIINGYNSPSKLLEIL